MNTLTHKMLSISLTLVLMLLSLPMQSAKAATTELFISEYIEGSSFNKAIEIYNGTGGPVDLAGYVVELYSNGSVTVSQSLALSGTIAAGGVYVLAHPSADAAILAKANVTSSNVINFNGDDAVVLRKNGVVIDAFGQIGFDPGTEWTGGGLDDTLRRDPSVCAGDTTPSDAFNASTQWVVFVNNTFDGLGSHTSNCSTADAAPMVSSTVPTTGASNVALNSNISVTFSEPVNVIGSWFTLACSISGNHTASVSGGPTTFTLDPESDFVNGDDCTLTVFANQVSDQDSNDPPDNMTANFATSFSTGDACLAPFTPIYSIQGNGPAAAITGLVTTKGVVIGDYEGLSPALRGFYIQDPTGDGDPATSDGIFVFNGNNNSVSLGDIVRVSGTASEFQDQTQISSVSSIVKCGTGSVSPVDVTFPVPSADYLERYEGMLVRLPQTMSVTEHFQLGRFGQVVLSEGGRLMQPTNVVAPGAAALALQAENDLSKIILDDDMQDQNPDPIIFARGGQPLSASNTLRGGDTATGIVGVLTYTWAGNAASGNAYRIRPVNALNGAVNFEPANPRPATAPEVGGTIKVVGMNLLNFFNTFSGCTNGSGGPATDCRGADSQAEFDRQWPKTVSAILAMNADIIGVNEIENDGYGPASAIAFLVSKLNAATAPGTYAYVDVDGRTGQVNALGTDAIKVGMIYKPASVTLVGQTAALNSVAFVNGGDSGPRSRPALAQAFEQNSNGQRFIVAINHLKSKGSACDLPDANDGQGNCNDVRAQAAHQLVLWLASDPTGTGDPDILLIGDYNSYAMEDPIMVIETAGFTNLIDSFVGPDAYSYVFDGQWGYLDHAFGSPSILSQVTGVADYHINSDEPSVLDYNTDFKSPNQVVILYAPDQYRVSDHDPVIVGLCTPPTLSVRATPNVLWPPNHKYVTVNTSFVSSSDTAGVTLISVKSNESDNGSGDGDTANDIVIKDNDTFQLRAERSGGGKGRIYTIRYEATNICGATTNATATVTVPHNK